MINYAHLSSISYHINIQKSNQSATPVLSCVLETLNHTSLVTEKNSLSHLQPAAIAGFPSTRLISFHLVSGVPNQEAACQ